MNALAIPLHLAIKHAVFVLGQHLLLRRHLLLPALDLLQALAHAAQRVVERADDAVDMAQALAVAVFLVSREAVGDFPAGKKERG